MVLPINIRGANPLKIEGSDHPMCIDPYLSIMLGLNGTVLVGTTWVPDDNNQ